jgi:hypothetical protein
VNSDSSAEPKGQVTVTRRELLRASGTLGLLSLVGCAGGSSGAAAASSPAPSPGTIPPFQLTSAVGGTNLPFAFGHAFRQGDVPPGSVALGNGKDWQCTPLTFWPDGSLKHAIIAGHVSCTANVPSVITFTTGPAPGGTSLTESNLASALPPTTVSVGSQVITLNSLVGTSALQRTVCGGPVMSNWIYMQVVPGNAQLSVWFDIRLYSGGAIEVFPWIENGWLLVRGSTEYPGQTCAVSIGGSNVFSKTINIMPQTRIPLVSGTASACSYWWNGTAVSNPQITPRHSTSYLMATKLVPNYPFGVTSAVYSLALKETYSPNWVGNLKGAMGATGYHPEIGILPKWSAIYLAGGADPRAYNSVIANGLGAGGWPVHYRDDTTREVPNYIAYPLISGTWGGSPTIPGWSPSAVNASTADSSPCAPDTAHQPSLAFLPWLLTARWFFLDELLLWDFWNYCHLNQATRGISSSDGSGASQVFQGQIRAQGWSLRTLAQALCAVQVTHPSYTSLYNAWAYNMASYNGVFVTGTISNYPVYGGTAGAGWKNNLGCLGLYGANNMSPYGTEGGSTPHWWDAPWMQAIVVMSIGYAWDLGLPESAQTQSDHRSVRDFGYSQFIGRAAPAGSGGWDYREFSEYVVPFGSVSTTPTAPTWFTDWASAYPTYVQYVNRVNRASLTALTAPAATTMYYQNNPLGPTDWATSSGTCMHFTALSYAADHGATGAASAWLRITQSSSFTSYAVGAWQANPLWGIYPRNPPA